MTRPPDNRRLRCVASVVLIFFGLSICPTGLFVQSSSAADLEQLAEAQRLFEFAEYEQALDQVETLLHSGLPAGDDLRDTHLLKGRCLLAMDREPEALNSFCEVIKADSAWQPDPFVFKTAEIEAFRRARSTCELTTQETPAVVEGEKDEKKGSRKLLYYIVGGAALVAGAVIIAVSGGDDEKEDELGDFPDPPEE